MRVDTTVVETDIHYPTDSTLLGDGVRVLTRIMKKVAGAVGKVGTQLRDRSRSAKLKVLAIARASRNKTEQGREKMKKAYRPTIGNRPAGLPGKPRSLRARWQDASNEAICRYCTKPRSNWIEMIPRVQQVLRQTRERVLRGNTQAEGKLLSIFEDAHRGDPQGQGA